MTPRSTPSCPHERRPGTTVCLHCRHDQLLATRARRRRAALRIVVRGGAAAGIVAGLVTAAGALRTGGPVGGEAVAEASQPTEEHRFGVTQSGEVARPVAVTTPARAESLVTKPATAPAIAHGRTDLSAGLYAERIGDTVVVHFDTEAARTRRSDKFEHVVRETLPLVLGDAGREAVRRMAAGSLVPPGQLVAALDGAPIVVPVGDGRTLRIQPQARPGRDGPLVVAYRVVIELASASSAS